MIGQICPQYSYKQKEEQYGTGIYRIVTGNNRRVQARGYPHTAGPAKIFISNIDVNRPGLQLAGFYEYFDKGRIQIIGKAETAYLEQCGAEIRAQRIKKFLQRTAGGCGSVGEVWILCRDA